MFGKGISYVGDVLDLAAGIDVINKSGAWYQYNGDKIGQGRENAKSYLEEHPQILAEVDAKVREHYGLQPDEYVLQKIKESAAVEAASEAGADTAAPETDGTDPVKKSRSRKVTE